MRARVGTAHAAVVNEETAPGTISVAASENGVTKTSTSMVDCINADGTAARVGPP